MNKTHVHTNMKAQVKAHHPQQGYQQPTNIHTYNKNTTRDYIPTCTCTYNVNLHIIYIRIYMYNVMYIHNYIYTCIYIIYIHCTCTVLCIQTISQQYITQGYRMLIVWQQHTKDILYCMAHLAVQEYSMHSLTKVISIHSSTYLDTDCTSR